MELRGLSDISDTIKSVLKHRIIISMTLLAGGASLFVGNAHHAQMPEFTLALVPGDDGSFYTILLTASGIGALAAGIILESRSLLEANARTTFILVFLWCLMIIGFAMSNNPYAALALLFFAGFLELTYNSMAQTLVQLHSPPRMRGRVIGLYSMSSLGLKAFSGITVGVGGAIAGIHWSLGISAAFLLAFTTILVFFTRRINSQTSEENK